MTTTNTTKLPATKSLIVKQLELLNTVQQLSEAATLIDNQEILIYTRDANGTIRPVALPDTQSLMLTEGVLNDLRGGALSAMDTAILQLSALGLTLSEDAQQEIATTASQD